MWLGVLGVIGVFQGMYRRSECSCVWSLDDMRCEMVGCLLVEKVFSAYVICRRAVNGVGNHMGGDCHDADGHAVAITWQVYLMFALRQLHIL